MPMGITANHLYDDDRAMGFLGRLFPGGTEVPIMEIKTIFEWIEQIYGKNKSIANEFPVDLGAIREGKPVNPVSYRSSHSLTDGIAGSWEQKVIEQAVMRKFCSLGAENTVTHGAVQMEKMVGA